MVYIGHLFLLTLALGSMNLSFCQNDTISKQNVNLTLTETPQNSNNSRHLQLDIVAVLDRSMATPPRRSSQTKTEENPQTQVQNLIAMAGEAFMDPTLGIPIKLNVIKLIESPLETHRLVLKVETGKETFLMMRPPLTLSLSNLSHDLVVIFTRTSLCWTNHCQAKGLANIGAACQKQENVAIVRVMGESTAFALTHELGHVLNMSHVSPKQGCMSLKSNEDYLKIMAGSTRDFQTKFYNFASHWTWTTCCQRALGNFLESEHGQCLDKITQKKSTTKSMKS